MGSTSMYAGTVGPIWQSVSFPPDRDITDSEIYLIVAVLFFVDKNLRDGEPRVRRELNPAWDEKFGLPPGGATNMGLPALWVPSTQTERILRPPGARRWPPIFSE